MYTSNQVVDTHVQRTLHGVNHLLAIRLDGGGERTESVQLHRLTLCDHLLQTAHDVLQHQDCHRVVHQLAMLRNVLGETLQVKRLLRVSLCIVLAISGVVLVLVPAQIHRKCNYVLANLLAAQNGTLTGTGGTSIAEKYDVRKGTGKLSINAGGATVNNGTAGTPVSLTNQNAIFKLTLKDIDGTNDVSATSVIISDQTGKVTTVTPASGYEKAMYVALPTTATTLKFLVTGSDSKKYFNMASGLSLSASYYQSTIKLATVGHLIASNGKCYKDNAATPGGNTAVAKIAYLGDDAETSTTNTAFKNGLALALEDVSGTKTWCSQKAATCLGTQYDGTKFNDLAGIDNTDALVNHTGHTHAAASAARGYNSGTHPTGTSAWFLPSAGQWDKMATKAGSYENLKTNAGLQKGKNYWSSTEYNAINAWDFYSDDGDWFCGSKDDDDLVRSCLAF